MEWNNCDQSLKEESQSNSSGQLPFCGERIVKIDLHHF
jgi:endogenous inhibitor of DNA gyrase (YacG/DUF329 family)